MLTHKEPFHIPSQSSSPFLDNSGGLARATSAIQYGGLLPLFDYLILGKYRIKTNLKWPKIILFLADTKYWLILGFAVEYFEHGESTGRTIEEVHRCGPI